MAKGQQAKPAAKPTAKPAVPAVPAVAHQGGAMVVETTEVPDYLKREGAARGSENVTTDDIVIPRLEVVQALSPIVKEGDPKFNPNARPGMLVNSVTGQLYGKEAMVVPVYYTKQWLVWKKRKDDKTGKPLEGGFLGAYNSPEEAQSRIDEEVANGTNRDHIEVIDTPQHLCLLVDGNKGVVDEVMMSMPRTKAKISRQWNSMVKLAGGDRFARVYRVGTQLEKNARGDFYNYAIAQSGFPVQVLYKRAEKLYESIAAGSRRVVMDTGDFEGETGHSSGDGAEM